MCVPLMSSFLFLFRVNCDFNGREWQGACALTMCVVLAFVCVCLYIYIKLYMYLYVCARVRVRWVRRPMVFASSVSILWLRPQDIASVD